MALFINDDGNWECSECGAVALLIGYHKLSCSEIGKFEPDDDLKTSRNWKPRKTNVLPNSLPEGD